MSKINIEGIGNFTGTTTTTFNITKREITSSSDIFLSNTNPIYYTGEEIKLVDGTDDIRGTYFEVIIDGIGRYLVYNSENVVYANNIDATTVVGRDEASVTFSFGANDNYYSSSAITIEFNIYPRAYDADKFNVPEIYNQTLYKKEGVNVQITPHFDGVYTSGPITFTYSNGTVVKLNELKENIDYTLILQKNTGRIRFLEEYMIKTIKMVTSK